MNFEQVILSLRQGKKIRRSGWNNEQAFMAIEEISATVGPNDLLEDDWYVMEEPKKPIIFHGQIVYEDHGGVTGICGAFQNIFKQLNPWRIYKVTIEEIE